MMIAATAAAAMICTVPWIAQNDGPLMCICPDDTIAECTKIIDPTQCAPGDEQFTRESYYICAYDHTWRWVGALTRRPNQ